MNGYFALVPAYPFYIRSIPLLENPEPLTIGLQYVNFDMEVHSPTIDLSILRTRSAP